ncbi:ATP-binding protein, partial [Agathobaculum sp.]
VGTNYIFTYPYWAVNFTLSGYPLTFLTMLVVSLVTCTMTTKIKRQEDLRIEAAREKMRANLLRSVSHDIRTPLTSIIGSTSAMIENPDLPEQDRLLLLTDVRDDAQWLIRVVENLLSITRMGDTTTRLVKNPEPAEEILGAVTAKFRKRYPDVRLRVSVPEDLLFVPMDAVLISQVLSNLLENAVVHGGGHTTEIRLSVRREGPEAVFAVEDNGDGIEQKVLPHLFDGTLAAAAGDTENGGKRNMGLGLSVCQAIIHAHSGSIEAHNLMEGAEFVFRLPLEQEEEKA